MTENYSNSPASSEDGGSQESSFSTTFVSPEKLSEDVRLYERHPYLTEYREFLGPLSLDRMIGIGNNAVIIRHPHYVSKVVKISKGEAKSHKLAEEIKVHNEILEYVTEGHENGKIPWNARIPTVPSLEKFREKTIIVMEYIEGQNFMIKAYLDKIEKETKIHKEKLASLPKLHEIAKMRSMTDYQVMDYMERNYRFKFENFLVEWGEPVTLGIWEVNRELLLAKTASAGKNPLSKLRWYLYENGIELVDTHGWNFMYGKNNDMVWVIDFGMIGRVWSPITK